ncbi:MAG: saccharopine dehydrogenase NADP-binding domain-containing protein, partial [Saprospiraceae bacterium]|nr:saccharopine dehydrogenase NADP-binding domain-containing protein [Saprospiraceae bacterium]
MKTILVIGGYGNAGREIVKLILAHFSDLEIVIAGRNEKRARQCAEAFQTSFQGSKVQAARLDIQDADELLGQLAEADFVINASGTPQLTEPFIQALLQTGKDALDTQLATSAKHQILQKYAEKIKAAGICYITDGGFHPGVPGALVRYAAR